MDWEDLFASHIWDRGYSYYCEGAVGELVVSEDTIQADVEGTEDYEVEISLDDGEVVDMYCSCPYAADGRNCKHMAAVLYKWEKESGQKGNAPEKEDKIREIVENADIDVVRSFLVSVLKGNKNLLVRFNSIVKTYSVKKDLNLYTRQVDEIIRRYYGRNQFINYYEADSFISELSEIYSTDVRLMIDDGQYRKAFELINYVLTAVANVNMDDSDGGIGVLEYRAYELWLELLGCVNEEEKREMFRWFMDFLSSSAENDSVEELEEDIEQIVMEEFQEKEYVKQKLVFAEQMVEKAEQGKDDWGRRYQVGKWAIRYLNQLERLKYGNKERKAYCKEHWDSPDVREYYIHLCMQEKEYDQALEVLDESISLDKQYAGLLKDYSRQKKEIYLLKGDKKAYVEQLWELVLHYEVNNLETYQELKQQYTEEEWREKREVVFEKLPRYARIDVLYKEEKMYDRLLAYVLESSGLWCVKEYTEILKTDYPEQILQKYKKEINDMAACAGNRKKYQEMAAVLRSMKKIKGGEEIVGDIVNEWGKRYKNRPAMMEELRKI